jgi:hypothetical protein
VGHHLLFLLPGGHQQHRAQLLTQPSQACTVYTTLYKVLAQNEHIYCTLQCTPMGEERGFDYSTVVQLRNNATIFSCGDQDLCQ